VSYSVYLWHLPVLFAVSNRSLTSPAAAPGRGLAELVAIGLPLTLVLSALTYWQVERRGLQRRLPWSDNAPTRAVTERSAAGQTPIGVR
jgi:peptidoglycan/LPS O-acetylase OafA/YrhL